MIARAARAVFGGMVNTRPSTIRRRDARYIFINIDEATLALSNIAFFMRKRELLAMSARAMAAADASPLRAPRDIYTLPTGIRLSHLFLSSAARRSLDRVYYRV